MDYVLMTKEQVLEKYPIARGTFNAMLLHRHENGLYKAVRKIGRRIYIREDLLIEWIENQNEKAPDGGKTMENV